MATLQEDIIAALKAESTVTAFTTNISWNRIPESKTTPYIYFAARNSDNLIFLNNTTGPGEYQFELECTSTDGLEALQLRDAVEAFFDGHTGTGLGARNVAFITVDSYDDSYVSRQQLGDDSDLHIAGLTISIGVDGR